MTSESLSKITPGACGDPNCNVLHEDPSNPIHPERCGDYYGRLDVVCIRWAGHDGLHRTELRKDDAGVLSGIEWGRHAE